MKETIKKTITQEEHAFPSHPICGYKEIPWIQGTKVKNKQTNQPQPLRVRLHLHLVHKWFFANVPHVFASSHSGYILKHSSGASKKASLLMESKLKLHPWCCLEQHICNILQLAVIHLCMVCT